MNPLTSLQSEAQRTGRDPLAGKPAHTPTPWKHKGPYITAREAWQLVVAVFPSQTDPRPMPDAAAHNRDEADANARFILAAVNEHDALKAEVAKLRALAGDVTAALDALLDTVDKSNAVRFVNRCQPKPTGASSDLAGRLAVHATDARAMVAIARAALAKEAK